MDQLTRDPQTEQVLGSLSIGATGWRPGTPLSYDRGWTIDRTVHRPLEPAPHPLTRS